MQNNKRHLYRPERVNTADYKPRLFNFLSVMANGILAGMVFSLGAATYLSVDNKPLGAAIFSASLFVIFYYGFGFYTSKVGYCFNQNKQQNFALIPIWVGNVLGAIITGLLFFLLREDYVYKIFSRANQICGAKLENNPLSIIVSAVFCGFLMFLAVDSFKNAKNILQKHLVPFFTIMIFLVCEFDHFVSGTFFFAVADAISIKSIWYILLMTLGNSIGAVIIPLSHKGIKALKELAKSSN